MFRQAALPKALETILLDNDRFVSQGNGHSTNMIHGGVCRLFRTGALLGKFPVWDQLQNVLRPHDTPECAGVPIGHFGDLYPGEWLLVEPIWIADDLGDNSSGAADEFTSHGMRRRRAERALATVVATSYLLGVSTRVDKLAESLGVTKLPKSQVSVMAAELDEMVTSFRSRPLDASP